MRYSRWWVLYVLLVFMFLGMIQTFEGNLNDDAEGTFVEVAVEWSNWIAILSPFLIS